MDIEDVDGSRLSLKLRPTPLRSSSVPSLPPGKNGVDAGFSAGLLPSIGMAEEIVSGGRDPSGTEAKAQPRNRQQHDLAAPPLHS